MTQGYNDEVKSLMTHDTPATPHNGGCAESKNRYANIELYIEDIHEWHSITTVYC